MLNSSRNSTDVNADSRPPLPSTLTEETLRSFPQFVSLLREVKPRHKHLSYMFAYIPTIMSFCTKSFGNFICKLEIKNLT